MVGRDAGGTIRWLEMMETAILVKIPGLPIHLAMVRHLLKLSILMAMEIMILLYLC